MLRDLDRLAVAYSRIRLELRAVGQVDGLSMEFGLQVLRVREVGFRVDEFSVLYECNSDEKVVCATRVRGLRLEGPDRDSGSADVHITFKSMTCLCWACNIDGIPFSSCFGSYVFCLQR